MLLTHRPRRNRKSAAVRSLVRETSLSPDQFIYPLFIHAGKDDQPIESMPGCSRWSLKGLLNEVQFVRQLGVNAVVLFPAIEESLKTPQAAEAWNIAGLIPEAIRRLKSTYPDLCVITDVALDPYNSDGHDGLVRRDSAGRLQILNDETVEALCQQAHTHALAGADIVAPSDMMDGRVRELRRALDAQNYTGVSIMSYTAKYASCFYGPFRGALESAPKEGDKKTYQMDPANAREALREAALDEAEGADILMVKPAGPYLDIIARLRAQTMLPIAAYQVSGEYLMLHAAAQSGWLDHDKAVLESLTSIRRAGADMILTYYAKKAAMLLQG